MNVARAHARPRWAGGWLLAALLVLTPVAVRSATPGSGAVPAESGRAAIPAYTGYVTDDAGVLSEERRAQLEGFLDQFHTKTGAQMAVLTVQNCAPEDPVAYKVRVFQAWGVGDKDRDDGVLLLLAMDEHAYRFEVGYGLEGTLPDGWLSAMFRDLVRDKMRAGDVEGGVTAGVLAAAQRVAAEKGVTLEWNGRELRYDGPRRQRLPEWAVLLIVLGLMIIVSSVARGSRGYRGRGPWIGGGMGGIGGGWGGGWGGGGGGWGGGGGGSFGGFGGGSSGGGGGGGSW